MRNNGYGKVFYAVLMFSSAMPAGTSLAHHSYVMFDKKKLIEANAVVRVWEFTSPHATLWVYIDDASGKPKLWALEAPGPTQLIRNGWGSQTVNPGDKVKVKLNPLRSGEHGGSLVEIILADGRSMSTGGPPQPTSSK